MNMLKALLSLLLVAIVFNGCGSRARFFDASSDAYRAAKLTSDKIEVVAKNMAENMLSNRRVQDLPNDQVLAVSDFENNTTQRVDVTQITSEVTDILRNSGKFIVTKAVTGSGGTTDRMLNKARDLRNNAEFKQDEVVEQDSLSAPKYSLKGKVVEKDGEYYFRLELTEIERGIEIWGKSERISQGEGANLLR